MAVLLRKTCDEILEDYAIQEYCYMDLNPTTKNLTLYFQDQELLSLSGIRFSSLKPTLAEMEVAKELFTDWLHIHQLGVFTYIEEAVAFSELTKPANKLGTCEVQFNRTWKQSKRAYIHSLKGCIITIEKSETTLKIFTDADLLISEMTFTPSTPNFSFRSISVADKRNAQNLINAHIAYEAAREHVRSLKAALLAA